MTEGRFAPCQGKLVLEFINSSSKVTALAAVVPDQPLVGAVYAGDYELALRVDGMRIELGQRLGLLALTEGNQALGALRIRLAELPPGSFEEQALFTEQLRRTYDVREVDFVHSPARGLLLLDARFERSP